MEIKSISQMKRTLELNGTVFATIEHKQTYFVLTIPAFGLDASGPHLEPLIVKGLNAFTEAEKAFRGWAGVK